MFLNAGQIIDKSGQIIEENVVRPFWEQGANNWWITKLPEYFEQTKLGVEAFFATITNVNFWNTLLYVGASVGVVILITLYAFTDDSRIKKYIMYLIAIYFIGKGVLMACGG